MRFSPQTCKPRNEQEERALDQTAFPSEGLPTHTRMLVFISIEILTIYAKSQKLNVNLVQFTFILYLV